MVVVLIGDQFVVLCISTEVCVYHYKLCEYVGTMVVQFSVEKNFIYLSSAIFVCHSSLGINI